MKQSKIEHKNSFRKKIEDKEQNLRKKGKDPNSKVDIPKILKFKKYLFEEYDIRYNEISLGFEISDKGKNSYSELNLNNLNLELQSLGFKGIDSALTPLLKSDLVDRYDPLIDYFENLPSWDKTKPDYIELLSSFVKTTDQQFHSTQFKKAIVRMVACAMNVIPANKHCFTYKGDQHDGKTTFIRFLCPPVLKNYIKEDLDIHNKDGRVQLCKNLIINLDELSSLSKRDTNKTKAFFTIDKVKERLQYDKVSTLLDRRASFFASTNSSEFLTDETGSVRWLIFEVEDINHDNGGPKGYSKNVDIDLVYSQAYYLLKNGYNFKLTKDEILYSENNNTDYQILSLEAELIKDKFIPGENISGCYFLPTGAIDKILRDYTKANLSTYKIGKALRQLGFKTSKRYIETQKGNQTRRGYWIKFNNEKDIDMHLEIIDKYNKKNN